MRHPADWNRSKRFPKAVWLVSAAAMQTLIKPYRRGNEGKVSGFV